jgi:ATP-dependent DNA helicase RecQ
MLVDGRGRHDVERESRSIRPGDQADGRLAHPKREEDATLTDAFAALCLEEKLAHIVVECVAVMDDSGVCVGKAKIADILRGKPSRFVLENGYDVNPAFGRLKFMRSPDVRFVIDALVEDGLLEVAFVDDNHERPVLKVAPRGRLELSGGNPHRARLPWNLDQNPVPDYEPELYHDLCELRRRLASEEGVRPYHVAYDSALFAAAAARPLTIEELGAVHGWGPVKCERHGEAFLEVLRSSRGRAG